MTVRWKPLLILSGVFAAVAAVGLIAMTMVMFPRGVEGVLAKARADRKLKTYDRAEILYKQARQLDGRNPKVQEEFAAFYEEWLLTASDDLKSKLQANRFVALKDAARFGPTLAAPRRKLLEEALRLDDTIDAVVWAKELLTVEADDPIARYVVAADLLEESAPKTAEIQRHLDVLEKAKPRTVKTDWVAARLAKIALDEATLSKVLTKVRTAEIAPDASTLDRMALLRLRALDVQTTTDLSLLPARVEALGTLAKSLTDQADVPSSRVARVSLIIEAAQRDLLKLATADAKGQGELSRLTDLLETVSDAIFRKAAAGERGADLGVYLTYADHLRFREKRVRCLEVVEQAFKSPMGVKQATSEAAQGLHALAVESILGDITDKGRFERVGPHIKALMEGSNKRFQALGHLFQGAIDLELAGVETDVVRTAEKVAESSKLRISALNHLKVAAAELPDVAEAQARYGVALIISREVALGRQYLQKARRMGSLDVQYQIWAAWSMVQGGYPEDAAPIVAGLLAEVESGKRPKELAGTLHLLSAEIHQAARSPEELKKAISEYNRSFQLGQKQTPAVHLRLAQIEIMLGRSADALKRIDTMTKAGFGSAGAEQLAVLTLQELGKLDDAKARLVAAIKTYPKSPDLVTLDASFLVRDGKAELADARLVEFLATNPGNLSVVQTRAQVLAESLKKPAEARALLTAYAEKSENSAPLVQLALLDLQAGDQEAVAASIAKIRARWKEAAAGDLLDAQLALARGNSTLAAKYFDDALKKDPGNKVVQFWKAQLDGRTDPTAAAKVLTGLAAQGSVKEIDDGLSLMTAAQSALANLALESGDLDGAISRYEGLLKSGAAGNIARGVRWQLVAAHAAKREWAAAKAEIAALLNDPKSPPRDEERVKAATYFRTNGDTAEAVAQLDQVLSANPANPAAVVIRSEMLASAGKGPEALALIRKAIASAPDKSKSPAVFPLMLAAIENISTPAETGLKRALDALDEGLVAQPGSVDLVQAKCKVLALMQSPKAASDFVEGLSKADPKGPWKKILVGLFRDARDYAGAERISAELARDNPSDPALAAQVARFLAAQAIEAAGKGDVKAVESLNVRTATLVRDARLKFPNDTAFLQLDCELAARKGEMTRAIAITQEIDKLTKGSSIGPLLRAQIYAVQGQTREVAAAYTEALSRNPRQPEVRLQLARASLSLGERDEAIRQTGAILDIDPDQPAALLVHCQALAAEAGSATQVAQRRDKALELLGKAIVKNPAFAEAYHLMADIHLKLADRPKAVADLKAGLKAVPNDAGGLSLLIRLLVEPKGPKAPATEADLADAQATVESLAAIDKSGNMALAAAVGFHKTGRFDLALPWAEKAVVKLDGNPVIHLNYGDLLLSLAESSADPAKAKGYFEKAIAQYDRVLKVQPISIEAINNKSWILHTYLNRSQEALELARGVLAKVDPSRLPAEFYDTLGTIQFALGQTADAEESFRQGLRKSPELPVLNYHMGKLMAGDRDKRKKALAYLEKARAGQDQLSAEMVADVTTLLRTSGQ